MRRLIGAVFATILVCGLSGSVRAADTQDAKTVVDKALGGEEALSKIKAASLKSKGTITFGGNTSENTSQATMQDLDHFRQETDGEINGN